MCVCEVESLEEKRCIFGEDVIRVRDVKLEAELAAKAVAFFMEILLTGSSVEYERRVELALSARPGRHFCGIYQHHLWVYCKQYVFYVEAWWRHLL